MTNYVLTDAAGLIVNRVVIEDINQWQAPAGLTAHAETGVTFAIGGQLVGGVYTPPSQPAPPTVTAVQAVTPRQARLALYAAGLLPQVEAAVNTAGGATKITWEYASEIRRDDPLITAIGTSLGLTDAAIDLLFKQAAQIS